MRSVSARGYVFDEAVDGGFVFGMYPFLKLPATNSSPTMID
jgi:hypothetical protein